MPSKKQAPEARPFRMVEIKEDGSRVYVREFRTEERATFILERYSARFPESSFEIEHK